MNVYLDAQSIITTCAAITALIGVFALIFKVYKWYLRQEIQDEEIRNLKNENTLLCYGISACLDGLMQLGANHTVPDAKKRLDKHLNQTAHK